MRKLPMIFLVIALPSLGFGYDGTNTYTFTNNDPEKRTATDIHIQFDHAVYWDTNNLARTWQLPALTFDDCNYHGGFLNEVDFAIGSDGKGVPFGKSVELDLAYYGVPPKVLYDGFTGFSYTIPTVSQWGLIVMGLLMLTVGTIFIRKNQTALAPADGPMAAGFTSGPLFAGAVFYKVLAAAMTMVLLGVVAFIWRYGTISVTDLVGALLCADIVAYWVHLLLLWRNSSREQRD